MFKSVNVIILMKRKGAQKVEKVLMIMIYRIFLTLYDATLQFDDHKNNIILNNLNADK